jgi:glycosyltransferase involved in cell wall biosynthesis
VSRREATSPRVTLVTTADRPGGVGRHMLDLASGLAARGVAVRLAFPARASSLRELTTKAGLHFVPIEELRGDGGVLHVHLADTYDGVATRLLLASHFGRWSARVLTEHLPRTNASDVSLQPGRRTPGAAVAKTVVKWAQLLLVDRVVVVSRGSYSFLRQRYRVPQRRISLVRNAPMSLPEIADGAPRSEGGPIRVLAMGSLIHQKGHDVLIHAAARLDKGVEIRIAGDGPHFSRLQDLADAVAGGRVELLGWREDSQALLLDSDVVCMPSRWEAYPYAALEAMQAARPLVATQVDGLDEIVVDGETGLLVAPDDPAGLADALERLARSRELRRAMGRAGQARVKDLGTFEEMVDQTVAVYMRALS